MIFKISYLIYLIYIQKYAKKLKTEGRVEEAQFVLRLNVALYPYDPYVYQQLGVFYLKQNKIELAKENLFLSLKLNPDNPYVIDQLSNLNN